MKDSGSGDAGTERGTRKLERFEDLTVWQKAHELALKVYRMSAYFPREEQFGLISQMRRAAVSVPANIAEGFKKRGGRDKAKFYNISQGSLEELRYYLILSRDLGYTADTSDIDASLDEVGRMLHGLIASVLARTESRPS
jgi:four helix bundle protein